MKQILIGALMVITSYGAQSQNLWKAPILPEEHIEVSVSDTPTTEEYHLIEQIQDTFPNHFRIHPPMMMMPKPEKVIRKGNKVILIFDKNEFDKFRRWDLLKKKRALEIRKEWQKRVEHNSIRKDYLEKNPNYR